MSFKKPEISSALLRRAANTTAPPSRPALPGSPNSVSSKRWISAGFSGLVTGITS